MKDRASNGVQVADDEVYLVVNAGCREKDIKHLSSHLKWFKASIPH